jgi:hypothetical protein
MHERFIAAGKVYTSEGGMFEYEVAVLAVKGHEINDALWQASFLEHLHNPIVGWSTECAGFQRTTLPTMAGAVARLPPME